MATPLVGCALAEYELENEDAPRDYLRQAVAAFEQVRRQIVFGMQEHSTLLEAAERLKQKEVVIRIFADQFKSRPTIDQWNAATTLNAPSRPHGMQQSHGEFPHRS